MAGILVREYSDQLKGEPGLRGVPGPAGTAGTPGPPGGSPTAEDVADALVENHLRKIMGPPGPQGSSGAAQGGADLEGSLAALDQKIEAFRAESSQRFSDYNQAIDKIADSDAGKLSSADVSILADKLVENHLDEIVAALGHQNPGFAPSEVLFEDGFVKVVLSDVRLSEDQSIFILTTEFRNKTNEPLYIGRFNKTSHRTATTNRGDAFRTVSISAPKTMSSGRKATEYSSIPPEIPLTIVWQARTSTGTRILGEFLSVTAVLFRFENGQPKQFDPVLAKVQIR